MYGDDIGLEVVPEAVKVMKAAAGRPGFRLSGSIPIGKAGQKSTATRYRVTEETLHKLRRLDDGPDRA